MPGLSVTNAWSAKQAVNHARVTVLASVLPVPPWLMASFQKPRRLFFPLPIRVATPCLFHWAYVSGAPHIMTVMSSGGYGAMSSLSANILETTGALTAAVSGVRRCNESSIRE